MDRLGIKLALYSMALLASACSTGEERLCRRDVFFCDKDWEKRLPNLTSKKLYGLDLTYTDVWLGGHALIEQELGQRGPEALEVMLDATNYRRGSGSEYEAMLSNIGAVRTSSGIDACSSPYRERFARLLEKSAWQDPHARDFAALCHLR